MSTSCNNSVRRNHFKLSGSSLCPTASKIEVPLFLQVTSLRHVCVFSRTNSGVVSKRTFSLSCLGLLAQPVVSMQGRLSLLPLRLRTAVANRSSFSSGSFSFCCIGATVFVAPRKLRKITISKTTTAVSNDRMIARTMFTLMNSIDLLLYMQSTIPFLVHVERLECRKLISIVREC